MPYIPHNCNILLVEDDRDILEAMQDLLETEGHLVQCATNGQEALDLLRKSIHPKLILLDLMMPIKDGFQFRKEQIQDPNLAHIPVVIMSADGQIEKKLHQIGAHEYLKKPVDIDIVLETVKRYCCL